MRRSVLFWQLFDDGIDVVLHDCQLVVFVESHYLLHDVLEGLDEVFESHLVLVDSVAHNPDKDEVVVVLSYLMVGHSLEAGQLGELGGGQNPLGPDAALAVEDSQHVFDDVHFLYLFALDVQYLFERVVVLSDLHLSLLGDAPTHQVKSVRHHYLLDVLVDRTHLFLCLPFRESLMLDVERRVVVGLERSQGLPLESMRMSMPKT